MAVSAAFFCFVLEVLVALALLGIRWTGGSWLLAGAAAAVVAVGYYQGLSALQRRLSR